MDDSKSAHDDIGDHQNFLDFTHKHEFCSQNFLANLMKQSLLLGADKLLMARKLGPAQLSDFEPQTDNAPNNPFKNSKIRGEKYANRKVKNGRYNSSSIEYNPLMESSNNNEFPFNFIAFVTVLVFKLATFQISLFLKLFTFPIWFFNSCLMFFMFPFQILTHVRSHVKKKLVRALNVSYMSLISFICNKIKSQKSVLKLGVRFGKACFCAVFVFFVLVGLLVSGFAIGGVVMRNLVEESVLKTEILNFDYTKTSPVAVVPISSSLVNGVINSKYQTVFGSDNHQGQRAIPYNHKLKVTVSLTLPESEYNRKLGVFQVRVETLSANGNPILGSSYPTMLRFKSQPIRVVETLFNSVPLITGLKSEVQNLKIVMGDFNEGYEPTSFFKVILEQRAEFQAGSGVPEIYAASLEISSELPKLKRVLWSWRRTIFVWISFGVFMAEITVFLILFRAVIFPGGKPKGVGSKKKYKIPGQKGI
ncbi:hypothetical protein DH2020_033768 [Rehmannia glutinosa]|uniref:Seipin n=1 Tax=Rehmannia glutinosa TaxID=99300 RepID=A0ABR0VD42_REHGL